MSMKKKEALQDASWLPRPRRRDRPELANQRIKSAGGADIIKKAHQNTYLDFCRRVVDPMMANYVRVTARLQGAEYVYKVVSQDLSNVNSI